jgi:hypothetical protein
MEDMAMRNQGRKHVCMCVAKSLQGTLPFFVLSLARTDTYSECI